VVVWPAMDGDEGGVVIAARWGAGCGVEGGGEVVMVLEAVVAAARVGTEVVGGAGGEWHRGSNRSGDGEYFWGSPEKFFGGGGGGRRWPAGGRRQDGRWPASGGNRLLSRFKNFDESDFFVRA
nr:hypothetical protein [Tanacetum cinerariifolium]